MQGGKSELSRLQGGGGLTSHLESTRNYRMDQYEAIAKVACYCQANKCAHPKPL